MACLVFSISVGGWKAPGWNSVKQQKKAREVSYFFREGAL